MPFVKKVKKYARKQVRRGYRLAKRRYTSSKGGFRYNKLVADVMRLKSIVNAEKKQFASAVGTASIGQVNGNAEGAYTIDITPPVPQGSEDSQRNGDSIKLTTAVMQLQFWQQTNCSQPVKVIVEIIQVLGAPQSTSTLLQQYLKPNPFITGASIRDAEAMMDQDYRQQYRVIFRRVLHLPPDATTGGQQIKSFKFPLRFGRNGMHVKYIENTTATASGQLMLMVRADNGNISGSTTSTLGNVITTGTSTGLNMNRNIEYYYYDN